MKRNKMSLKPAQITNLMQFQKQNQDWERAIACFRLPIIWLAIGLLLLNDHVLKYLYPSWVTGKLSDFAGLLIFPLLLATFMLPLLMRLRFSYRQVGVLAILITAVWFTLMKTTVLVNEGTIRFWELIIDTPVQIIRDPTDLIALPVLWCSWLIWTRPRLYKRSVRNKYQGKLLPLSMICLGTFASLATSPLEDSFVVRLDVVDDQLYLSTSYYAVEHSLIENNLDVYQCDENLDCHTRLRELPQELRALLAEPKPLPLKVCLPDSPTHCFRTGTEVVEESTDGGTTWQIAWQVPPGRRPFMERSWSYARHIDMGPYDITVAPYADGSNIVVAAMGNQGILVRSETGVWERQAVHYIKPAPFLTDNFLEIHQAVAGELFLWSLFGVLLISVSFVLTWRISNKEYFILGFIVAIFVGFALLALIGLNLFFGKGFVTFFYFFLMGFAAGMILWWIELNMDSEEQNPKRFHFWLMSILLVGASVIPLLLWPMGIIRYYQVAVGGTVFLAVVAIVLAVMSWVYGRKVIES